MDENMKKYWLERYKEDKIGTIAKLSQAMQHMAWLREWQRVHGDEPRIKPITEKVNGEKVKVGESDIAVPWSELDGFFRAGNEYGDVETVKFLMERIENGDISELTDTEIHDLSEKENVKWSDGKHSLNPFQGYLYDFTAKNAFILETPLGEEDYGKFYPVNEYRWADEFWQGPSDLMPNDSEKAVRINQTHAAFQRYYTTRLMQQLLSSKKDSKYYDFVDFDITSVTTPEQIAELDKKLVEIVQSPEMQAELEGLEGNKEFEKSFYDKLRKEVEIEIKKDSDRIENAHKVFVALETGNLDEILEDPETAKWAREVYEKEKSPKVADRSKHMRTVDEISDKIAEGLGISKETARELREKSEMFIEISEKMHNKGQPYMGHENPEVKDLPKQIATADKEAILKESELMPIKKKGLKEWIKGLVDKLMGKGEK